MRLDASWSIAGAGQRLEERDRPQEPQLPGRRERFGVQSADPAPEQGCQHGQERAGHDQCAADPDRLDHQRRRNGAEAQRRDEDALHDAEHAGENLVRDRALEKRQGGDVDDGVPDSDKAEEDESDRRIREDADQGNRKAPHDQSEPEIGGELLPSDERERGESPEEAADADRRVQEADARLTQVEQLERRDDDQDVERTRDQRLGPVEADDQPQVAIRRDRAEAGEELL